MKLLLQLALCGVLAPGLFADRPGGAGHGGVIAGHHGGHRRGSIRSFGYRGYGGYGGYLDWFPDSWLPDDYGYPLQAPVQPAAPGPAVVYVPPAEPVAPAPPAHPVIHEYDWTHARPAPPEAGNHPLLYLIAFRNKTIRAATTYWVEGGTLHYLDTDHQERQAPVSSVDTDLSARLNRERHIPFSLP